MFAILRGSPGRDDRRDRIRQSANYLRARVLSGSGEECDSSRQCIHDFRPVLDSWWSDDAGKRDAAGSRSH
jgi:hypothetical protein